MSQDEIEKKLQEEEDYYNRISDAIDHVLTKPFWDRAKIEPELFKDIFANRKKEIEEFTRIAKPLLGDSILLLGRQGVGKSSLIYKLSSLIESKTLLPDETRELKTLLLDLENENDKDVLLLIKKATKLFVDYIEQIAPGQFTEFKTIEQLHPTSAVHLVVKKLSILAAEKKEKMPYIFFFIDDMDYAIEIWFDLITQLTPITAFPFISPVYAARPFLESKMFSCDDARMQRILGDAKKIHINTLPAKELIIQRLFETAKKTQKKWWLTILASFGINQDELLRLLEKVALKKDGEFKYPFATKLENFIEKTTNGNSREMLHMIRTCLKYIIKNRKQFKPQVDNLYHFERALIINLFKDYDQSPIVNLNDSRFHSYQQGSPKSGNALLFNILEWIEKCEGNDHKVEEAFFRLGHTTEDIQKGLDECFNLRLIEPQPRGITKPEDKLPIHSYQLTPKGKFHITHIITWSEYQAEFGNPKDGISRDFYKKLPQNAMYTDIIEFLLYIATAVKEVNGTVMEFDLSLTSLIDEYVRYQSRYLRGSVQKLYSPDNPNCDYMIDEDKLNYLFNHLPVLSDKYPLLRGKYEVHQKKRPNIWQRIFNISAIEDIAKKLKIGRQSKLGIKDRCDFNYFYSLAKEQILGNANYTEH